MTDSRGAATALVGGSASRHWRSLARRGMLFSECESIDHVVLEKGSVHRSDPDAGTEYLWYVVSGDATFRADPEERESPVRAGHVVLVPAGTAGRLLSLSTTEIIVITCVPDAVARRLPPRAPSLEAPARGIPTATNVDHIAYTVPDLDEAVRFFVDVLGADLLYREGTIRSDDDEWMREALNVHPRATADIAMLRLGPVTNIELFEYTAPDQNRTMPKNSDHGGHHLAFYVRDIDEAAAYLRKQPGVQLLGDPRSVTTGPIAGDRWLYFLTPWGMQMELISLPAHLPYERDTPRRRFGPCAAWSQFSDGEGPA
ncbi:VOC family protein [Streptomyces viridochromogenes]|uniref:VOC family protein n=1 Tax=Streptomyces viridochromogenes TaxID=1938 RepID=UPI001F434750|nr:VOC family protein [Streptomyces viridochromogenes]